LPLNQKQNETSRVFSVARRKVLNRSQTENELQDELRSHIERRADDLERSG
jgi:hypothetical protein